MFKQNLQKPKLQKLTLQDLSPYLPTSPSLKDSIISRPSPTFVEDSSIHFEKTGGDINANDDTIEEFSIEGLSLDNSQEIDEGVVMLNRKLMHNVPNFHKTFIGTNMWPAIAEQEQLQGKNVREKKSRVKQPEKNSMLKRQPKCKSCKTITKREKKTRKALNEALSLSSFLLREVQKLQGKLVEREGMLTTSSRKQ